ncbi:hypothetical protein M407DRAFT_34073 [Tulasnella calospora MUT 4182]|uniref:TPR-like protein n=1 Tax=Tulasnella calospora MUT 4182 TaxID=1051891 RepID=A0A0C3L3H7_9AGAM|nr:hypothetical protein M407DRAFT_34073 [Tulasnella calospora MUT 4182]
MGRTRTKKAQRALKSTVVSTTPTVVPQPAIESLVEKTQILLAQCNYELAHKFIKRILERDSTHVEGREMLGLVELENGNIEAAKAVFVTLIPPSLTAPTPPSASAYLYLAQLTDDDPNKALELYRNALNLMSSQLKGKAPASQEPKSSEMEEQTRKTAVRTVIAMVEIWMSDLCFEPQAETECESLLKLAFELDPENPEALVSLASVRISQQRPEEAKDLVQRSWTVWKDLESDGAALPPISSRLSLTRLMLELSMYTQALAILHGVLASDEQEVEAWYLQGWCFFLIGDALKEGQSIEDAGELTWQDMKRDARIALEKCKEVSGNLEVGSSYGI